MGSRPDDISINYCSNNTLQQFRNMQVIAKESRTFQHLKPHQRYWIQTRRSAS